MKNVYVKQQAIKQTIPEAVSQVIRNSNIVLCVLDARYLSETRNLYIEEKIREMNKKIIYVLNKSDLAFNIEQYKRVHTGVINNIKAYKGKIVRRPK